MQEFQCLEQNLFLMNLQSAYWIYKSDYHATNHTPRAFPQTSDSCSPSKAVLLTLHSYLPHFFHISLGKQEAFLRQKYMATPTIEGNNSVYIQGREKNKMAFVSNQGTIHCFLPPDTDHHSTWRQERAVCVCIHRSVRGGWAPQRLQSMWRLQRSPGTQRADSGRSVDAKRGSKQLSWGALWNRLWNEPTD